MCVVAWLDRSRWPLFSLAAPSNNNRDDVRRKRKRRRKGGGKEALLIEAARTIAPRERKKYLFRGRHHTSPKVFSGSFAHQSGFGSRKVLAFFVLIGFLCLYVRIGPNLLLYVREMMCVGEIGGEA